MRERFYVMFDKDTDYFKMGMTRRTGEKRAKDMSTGRASDLIVIYEWSFYNKKGARQMEAYMKDKFSDYRIKGKEFFHKSCLDKVRSAVKESGINGYELKKSDHIQEYDHKIGVKWAKFKSMLRLK